MRNKAKFKQTEIGGIPEGWEPTIFSEAISVNPRRMLTKGTEAKYISMADLKEHNKKIQAFITRKYSGGSKFINGDTLMARITPCLENGKTAFVDILSKDEVGSGSTEFIVLSTKNDRTLQQYVYYLAISPGIQEKAIKSMTGTSGRQRVETDVFDKIEINLPDPKEQRAIAKILSDLDDKIKLNHQMNKTLESIAQVIFKRWFVDFEFPNEHNKPYKSSGGKMVDSELGEIPEGWNAGMLLDILELQIGGDWGEDDNFEGAVRVVSLRGTDLEQLKSCGYALDAPVRWIKNDSLGKRRIDDCDILIGGSGLGPIGRSIYCSSEINSLYQYPVTYSNFCKRLSSEIPAYAIYAECILENMYRSEEIKQYFTGTSIPNLDTNSLLSHEIVIPPKTVATWFYQIVKNKYARLYNNENIILSQIRDSLLPRLMLGKIRVAH